MKVFYNAIDAGRWAPSSVAAIGKFEALHIGHQKLISLAVERSKTLKTKTLVVTFDPLPREFFSPGCVKPILSRERLLPLLAAMGVDATVLLPFKRRLACQAPEAFAQNVLVNALKVVEVFVGSDFCFGKDRVGRVEHLTEYGRELGFLVQPVPLVKVAGEKVSSSFIRQLLQDGRAKQAERMLGRSL